MIAVVSELADPVLDPAHEQEQQPLDHEPEHDRERDPHPHGDQILRLRGTSSGSGTLPAGRSWGGHYGTTIRAGCHARRESRTALGAHETRQPRRPPGSSVVGAFPSDPWSLPVPRLRAYRISIAGRPARSARSADRSRRRRQGSRRSTDPPTAAARITDAAISQARRFAHVPAAPQYGDAEEQSSVVGAQADEPVWLTPSMPNIRASSVSRTRIRAQPPRTSRPPAQPGRD
jgi:hypothetical protein